MSAVAGPEIEIYETARVIEGTAEGIIVVGVIEGDVVGIIVGAAVINTSQNKTHKNITSHMIM